MKVFLNILGGLLLIGGIGLAIYIVVAVANQEEGFKALSEMVPELAGHALALFFGIVCIGIGQRIKKQAA